MVIYGNDWISKFNDFTDFTSDFDSKIMIEWARDMEDIIEEEETDDEEEEEDGKQDTVKEKFVRRSVESSERDTASEGGDEVFRYNAASLFGI